MNWEVFAIIAAPIISLFLGVALTHWFENRPKIVAHYGHVSGFRSQQQPGPQPLEVNTHSVVIRNTSNTTIKNISVTHNYLPDYCIFPEINYSVQQMQGGGKEILFPSLAAKDEISITYLYFPPITYNQIRSFIRAENSPVKIIDVWQAPIVSKKVIKLLWFFIITGVITWIYFIYLLALKPGLNWIFSN